MLKRGDFLKPVRPVDAGRAGRSCNPLPPGAGPNRLDLRASGWWTATVADDGAGHRQPRLAGLLRHRPGRAPARTSACRASRPAHPELLDWLAVEFMDSGWSLKALHRLIVTSATYRQSSR